ncbi:MAG: ribokinase [Clostridia bacterium]|nr:ribokinase [Clostridia bacterium]
MNKPKILVVGSLVMDLIVTTSRFCGSGETVIGKGFSTAAGGKGANQAVQAARLGADVTMVGMVGNDDFGKQLIASAKESGVNTEYILVTNNVSSAIGNVQIQQNENGTENRIIVVPGANFELTTDNVEFLKDIIANYDIVILQNEISTEVNLAVAKLAKEKSVPVMLNPAPYRELPPELISYLSYISPNEHEAADIAGVALENKEDISVAIAKLHEMGTENALITLGKRGCAYSDGKTLQYSSSIDCGKVLDPTAAGDSFIGAFCTAIAAGADISDSLKFANCTAGITVTKMGAQTSLPKLLDVLKIMNQNGYSTEAFDILKGE